MTFTKVLLFIFYYLGKKGNVPGSSSFLKTLGQCPSEVGQTRVGQPRSLPLTWPVVILGTVTIRFFVKSLWVGAYNVCELDRNQISRRTSTQV